MKNTLQYFFYSLIFKYPTPINLNYNYNFGVLALLALGIQIITGIIAVMFYTNNTALAFDSIIRLMTEIENGWLLRYIHANMASFFFIVVFLHIARGIFYGSYKKPRSSLWYSGIVILFILILTAFLGYTLPWGQMSFWGATVITNFVSILPFIGSDALQWIWGGFSVSNPTLGKFFSLHYLAPFILFCIVVIHLYSLHNVGSSNPLGHAYNTDKIFFTPFYTQKDFVTVWVFLFIFSIICGQYPNYLGHSDNWIRANNLVTPTHIVPEWYFLLFYAILRAIPEKTLGVIFLVFSIFALVVIALRTLTKSSRVPLKKMPLLIFFAVAIILTNMGAHTYNNKVAINILFLLIFVYFLFLVFSHKTVLFYVILCISLILFILTLLLEYFLFKTISPDDKDAVKPLIEFLNKESAIVADKESAIVDDKESAIVDDKNLNKDLDLSVDASPKELLGIKEEHFSDKEKSYDKMKKKEYVTFLEYTKMNKEEQYFTSLEYTKMNKEDYGLFYSNYNNYIELDPFKDIPLDQFNNNKDIQYTDFINNISKDSIDILLDKNNQLALDQFKHIAFDLFNKNKANDQFRFEFPKNIDTLLNNFKPVVYQHSSFYVFLSSLIIGLVVSFLIEFKSSIKIFIVNFIENLVNVFTNFIENLVNVFTKLYKKYKSLSYIKKLIIFAIFHFFYCIYLVYVTFFK